MHPQRLRTVTWWQFLLMEESPTFYALSNIIMGSTSILVLRTCKKSWLVNLTKRKDWLIWLELEHRNQFNYTPPSRMYHLRPLFTAQASGIVTAISPVQNGILMAILTLTFSSTDTGRCCRFVFGPNLISLRDLSWHSGAIRENDCSTSIYCWYNSLYQTSYRTAIKLSVLRF